MNAEHCQTGGACATQRRRVLGLIFVACIFVLVMIVRNLFGTEPASPGPTAPELVGIAEWINAEPTTLKSLRGKVVVLHFWTFGCINCQRNLPYYNRWRKDFSQDELEIVGVHTPESAHEGNPRSVAAQVKQLGIKYPVAIDNDRTAWKAYKNRYWPSIYLIDRAGRVRFRWDGELEFADAGGDKRLRSKIKELLAEPREP
jgi:peroxiredoxin